MKDMSALLVFTLALSFAVSAIAEPVRIAVKPGESLAAARDAVRALVPADKARGVEVVLADGDYFLSETLEFSAGDGGDSSSAPVVWRSARPGGARIVGAARIPPSAFRKVVNPAFLERLPEAARGRLYAADVSNFCAGDMPPFESKNAKSWVRNTFQVAPPPAVFVDGRFATLAKYPNGDGWITFSNQVDRGSLVCNGGPPYWANGAFVCDDQRLARWNFSKGVWMNGYWTHDWDNCFVKASFYGTENGTGNVVRLDSAFPYGVLGRTWGRKERRFRAVNLLEELDEPGEWWLDRERKVLFLIPFGGDMQETTDVRIAFSEKPLLAGKGVANLRFNGLSVSFNYGPLVEFLKCEGVEFRNCTLSCTSGTGVKLESGSRNALVGCEVVGIGCTGVSISGGDRRTLSAGESRVEDCRIHGYGVEMRTYAPGIRMGGCGNVLRGNEIFDAPHCAVLYETNDCLIESNDVHHVCLETGDAGAIYTGRDWTTQGNVLRYNFLHDLGGGTTEREGADAAVSGTNVMGMYFDDCDCGDEVYGNVFCNLGRGIMIGGGRDHPVRDNVFINCRLGLSIDCRGITWKTWNSGGWNLQGKAQEFDYTNGVWAARYPRLANIMEDHPREPLYNPVTGNVFIDCAEVIQAGDMFSCENKGLAPGLVSRMAPIRDNTVIYTKGSKTIPGFKPIDRRIASGFRILGL